jgi:NADH dehydrogenase FAD-containing subunit
MVKRRDFIKWAGVAGIGIGASGWSMLAGAAVPTNTGIKGRVVVVGGGMAGATVAKYLRLWGGSGVDVTLIERDSSYASNIMSNLVLNGSRTMSSLQYGYGNLASRYGVKVVKGEVATIDPVGRSVTLTDRKSVV